MGAIIIIITCLYVTYRITRKPGEKFFYQD